MRTLLKKFSYTCFPRSCLLCVEMTNTHMIICDHCLSSLPWYRKNTADETQHSTTQLINHVDALFHYEPPITTLIQKLKFRGELSIAYLFSQLWIQRLQQNNDAITLPQLILPVPLHPKRLQERGFNQALEIAKPIGKYCQLPVESKSCVRIKNTHPQSTLTAISRKHNMKNAFGLSYNISAKRVVILDDVITTGNTVSEIAYLLQKMGVETIDVWCCARAGSTQ